MNNVEYKDKLWKYWHGKLGCKQKDLLWAEIHKEYLTREKKAHCTMKVVVMAIIILLILHLFVW